MLEDCKPEEKEKIDKSLGKARIQLMTMENDLLEEQINVETERVNRMLNELEGNVNITEEKIQDLEASKTIMDIMKKYSELKLNNANIKYKMKYTDENLQGLKNARNNVVMEVRKKELELKRNYYAYKNAIYSENEIAEIPDEELREKAIPKMEDITEEIDDIELGTPGGYIKKLAKRLETQTQEEILEECYQRNSCPAFIELRDVLVQGEKDAINNIQILMGAGIGIDEIAELSNQNKSWVDIMKKFEPQIKATNKSIDRENISILNKASLRDFAKETGNAGLIPDARDNIETLNRVKSRQVGEVQK